MSSAKEVATSVSLSNGAASAETITAGNSRRSARGANMRYDSVRARVRSEEEDDHSHQAKGFGPVKAGTAHARPWRRLRAQGGTEQKEPACRCSRWRWLVAGVRAYVTRACRGSSPQDMASSTCFTSVIVVGMSWWWRMWSCTPSHPSLSPHNLQFRSPFLIVFFSLL